MVPGMSTNKVISPVSVVRVSLREVVVLFLPAEMVRSDADLHADL